MDINKYSKKKKILEKSFKKNLQASVETKMED